MIDLTPLINAVIVVCAALITCFLVPWIKEHTSAKERENLVKWAEIAVEAAQQLYYQKDGAYRLEYALEVLEGKGFDVDDAAVRDAIEAAVLKLHNELVSKDES